MAAILIIEDEPVLTHQLSLALTGAGHEVQAADTCASALAQAEADPPDLVLLDLRLPDGSGIELIDPLRAMDANLKIVLMTAYGSARDAAEAMRRGAVDYLQKPLDMGELGVLISRLLSGRRAERELSYYRGRDRGLPSAVFERDPRIAEAMAHFDRLCDPAARPGQRPSILIRGESGSGKSLVALALHRRIGSGPFLEVDAGEGDDDELDVLLFGRARSAEDPASCAGLLEAAEGGTLLVKNVERLTLEQQQRLLDVIRHNVVRRLGDSRSRETDVHIISTTTCDLSERVTVADFSAELRDRLSVLAMNIPPLRERPDDVRELAKHFAFQLGRQYGGVPRTLSPPSLDLLARYAWPGNVIELRNVIERAVLMTASIELGEPEIGRLLAPGPFQTRERFELPEGGIDLEVVERDLLLQALERARGNQTRASALLGLTRDTLRYRIRKWGLVDPSSATLE